MTMIDPATSWFEIAPVLFNKSSTAASGIFNKITGYVYIHDQRKSFTIMVANSKRTSNNYVKTLV